MSVKVQNIQVETTDSVKASISMLADRTLSGVVYLPFVDKIREYTYYGCSNVDTFVLPLCPSLSTIKEYSFANCGDITIKCLFPRARWNNITKETNWAQNSNVTVVCSDD